jgi:phosphoesterase RecJ-like protein
MKMQIREKSEELLKIAEKSEKVLIVGHIHPDGDCLGSMFALRVFFERLGKVAVVGIEKEDYPAAYSFLLEGHRTVSPEEMNEKFDLAISVDAPNTNRLGGFAVYFEQAEKKVNIDHHPDNRNFADLNIVVEDISSTSEIIFWLLKEMNFDIDYEIALPLYVGIVTDTGRFQYSNTLPSTFEAAKDLLAKGVSPVYVFRQVYENLRPEVLRLLGVVLERVKNENGLFWSYIEEDDFDRFNVRPAETENYIDYIRSIMGCKVAALFKKIKRDSAFWKVSLRSRGEVNVQELAAKFGGGGHIEASGCEVAGTLNEAVSKVLGEYRKLGVPR